MQVKYGDVINKKYSSSRDVVVVYASPYFNFTS